MERTGTHLVTYTNAGRIPVADVAASLIANEQLLKDAALLLREVFPNLTDVHISVNLKEATTSSPLKEYFAYALVIAYQEELSEEVPKLIEALTGWDVPERFDTLVTVLVMLVAIYGVARGWERYKSKNNADPLPPSIEGNYNTIIQVSGDMVGVEPKRLEEVLERQFKPKGKLTNLAKRAIEFIRPAKAEDGAGVKGGGVELTPEAVRDAPSLSDIALEEDVERQDPYAAEPIVIHATDLDRTTQGWAAHVPRLSERRMGMHLYPGVNPNDLFGKREVKADIIVVSRRNAQDEFFPYRILLLRLVD